MVLLFVWVLWVPFLSGPFAVNESISLTKVKGMGGRVVSRADIITAFLPIFYRITTATRPLGFFLDSEGIVG